MDISPLQVYCRDMDVRTINMGFREIHQEVKELDSQYFTNMVLSDFQWRSNHQMNIIASIEGQQGCGKSLFANDMCLRLGQMFNNPFLPERDLYINPFDLDHELRTCGSRRRTFLYDEQAKRKVGMGSVSTSISLTDYEEICRYCLVGDTQILTIEDGKLVKRSAESLAGKEFVSLSYDLKNNSFETDKAVCVFDSVDEITKIYLGAGKLKRVIETNKEHPFFVKRDNKVVKVKVKDLRVGDDLFCKKGGF